jgi:transcriptional regulator with PAS, ATPase and Fis domain
LQERVYEPLGSVQSVKADVRVVAATNKNLTVLVGEGKFREDLFYRINVVRIDLPPLRERMEDIPLLVDHLIARMNRIQGKEVTGITDEALTCLMSHSYPGNVRELENIIERALVLCSSREIESKHLPEPLCGISQTGRIYDLQANGGRLPDERFAAQQLEPLEDGPSTGYTQDYTLPKDQVSGT